MSTQRPFADDLGFLLSRASGVVAKSVSEALAPLGLRVRSYSVLAFATEEAGGVNQRRLAALMGLDPSQVVALIDELESRGLVRRGSDPSDRRNKLIEATEEGRRLRRTAQRRVEEEHVDSFERIPEEHVHILRETLRRIAFPDSDDTSPARRA